MLLRVMLQPRNSPGGDQEKHFFPKSINLCIDADAEIYSYPSNTMTYLLKLRISTLKKIENCVYMSTLCSNPLFELPYENS